MIVGPTLRIGWTIVQLAHRNTSQHTQWISLAYLVRSTLVIAWTGWHRGHLTLTSQRISHVGWGALTEWLVVSDSAHFIVATGHNLARVDTSSLPTDVNAAHMILRAVILILAGNIFVTAIIWILGVTWIAI
jgi:hypothetical protein